MFSLPHNSGVLVSRKRFNGMRVVCFIAVTAVILAATSTPGAEAAPRCFGKVATVVGTSGNNVLTGTPGADVIVGLGGSDRIAAGGGNDRR
jgi:Ca2+-binding RTX toxin-like protein